MGFIKVEGDLQEQGVCLLAGLSFQSEVAELIELDFLLEVALMEHLRKIG